MLNTKENIKNWLNEYEIENYTINDDLTVDVDDDVDLSNKGLTKLPIQFGKVTGNFWITNNDLENLKGCPEEVGGSFYCSKNELKSLKGAPEKVGDNFHCADTCLTSLENIPSEIGGNINISFNKLTNLKGCPEVVNGDLYVIGNKISSLEGTPKIIKGDGFYYDNPIKSFEYLPLSVEGEFKHDGDTKLGIERNQSLSEVRAILLKQQLEKEIAQKPTQKKSRPLKI